MPEVLEPEEHATPQGRLMQRVRNPQGSFDLYETGRIPQLYADGVSGIVLGPAVAKIDFYQVARVNMESDALIEQRELAYRITVPTISMVQMVVGFLRTMKGSADKALESNIAQIRAELDKISINDESA